MAMKTWNATALTGGTSRSLDSIPPISLSDGDRCFCVEDSVLYYYLYDAAATDAESSPDVIRPDAYSGSGVWKLIQSPLAEQHLVDRGFAETAITLDCASYDTHIFSCNQSTLTITLSGLVTGQTIALVIAAADDCTITWPAAVKWPAGSAPIFTSGTDRVTLQQVASDEIHAAISGQAYA